MPFTVLFRMSIYTGNKPVVLIARRKGMTVIPPAGMEVLIGPYRAVITSVQAPLSFDVITCNCSTLVPMMSKDIIEMIKKHGFREEFKNGDHPQTVLVDGNKNSDKVSSQVLDEVPLGGEPLGDKFTW